MESYHSHKDHHYWDGVTWEADFDKPAKVETIATAGAGQTCEDLKPVRQALHHG